MLENSTHPLIISTLTYEIDNEKHSNVRAVLFDDQLVLEASGLNRTFCLNQMHSISAGQYKIEVLCSDGTIILSMLGHLYEDFAAKLIRAYNEIVFVESLMKEIVHFETVGQCMFGDNAVGRAVFRVCDTALVILPDMHELVRIPFCMITDLQIMPYRFEITDRLGNKFVLQKMGMNTDAFIKAFDTQKSMLIEKTKAELSLIAPVSYGLVELLLDGIVVELPTIQEISPEFVGELEKVLLSSSISQEYAYFMDRLDVLAIGIKRGLMGDLTGERIILLAALFEKNIMLMETLGEKSSATYVFRITHESEVDAERWHDFLLDFNYSMLSVNFRREPIYLSEKALQSEKHVAYRNSLRRNPGLQNLRKLFVGRVIHNGFDSWKKKVDSYID